MHVNKTIAKTHDPQAPIAIAYHPDCPEPSRSVRWSVRLNLPFNQALDSIPASDEKRPFFILGKYAVSALSIGYREEFWTSGFPPPQAVCHTSPEVSFPVFVQVADAYS